MGNSIGVAINEIQKAIEEIRKNGEHHADFVQSNGELVISGLEMALDILNSAESKPCDDTISRQAAIEALKKISFNYYIEFGKYIGEDVREVRIINSNKALETIEAIPSAQPERKRGKIKIKDVGLHMRIVCDQCDGTVSPRDNYCRWCGADMRKVQNE